MSTWMSAMSTLIKSGKTFEYKSTGENKIGQGTFGIVFGGIFKSGSRGGKAAIKRVQLLHETNGISDIEDDREVQALKILRHPCIVTLYAVEDDIDFRNYVFELCEETLEDYIQKRYEDLEYRSQVMPKEVEGLFQMASGIGFIHKQNMIHRDIKPENVLIAPPQNGRARLKISDFGFTKKMEENDANHYTLASGLKGTRLYLAPELQKLANLINKQDYIKKQKCTSATDIFAAGCTFFRYLVKGCFHPFGSGDFNIQTNIMHGNPVNMLKEYFKDPWMAELVGKMIQLNPTERLPFTAIIDEILKVHPEVASIAERESDLISPVVVESNNIDLSKWGTVNDLLKFNRRRIIGKGGYSTVFEGIFENKKVAVKRVQQMDDDWKRDVENEYQISARLNHPNVVQYKYCVEDIDFRYIVLELCVATLYDFLAKTYKGPIPTKEQVLFQLAKGLDYIHSEKIIHRNIKPTNILISYSKPIQMKWSGFFPAKQVSNRGTFSISSGEGTRNWVAPELLERENSLARSRDTVLSDVHSSGCVFLYFLLDGVHPFGSNQQDDLLLNVIRGNPVNLKELPANHFARPFVVQMIEHDPEKRISLKQVIDYLTPLQPKSRLSDMQYDNQKLLSEGLFSSVYRISKFEEADTLAVKRFQSTAESLVSFEELRKLEHENIVRVLYYDLDDFHRYFGIELCAASLDQCFLAQEDQKKYNGPLPSDEIALFQLSSGLEFIHGKKLIHGSIKPSNILISSSPDPKIKLSDFGLTRKRWDEGSTSSGSVGGFQSSRFCWLAPELLHELNNKDSITDTTVIECTKSSDVFSTGSVLFYFYSRGSHLFGDQVNFILQNTQEGKQENLFRKQHFAIGLVRWMTTLKPEGRPSVSNVVEFLRLSQPLPEGLRNIGNIQFSKDHFVDMGGQALVFLGRSKGSIVAVKRMQIDGLPLQKKEKVTREREAYEKLDHRNIVKLVDFAEDDTFLVLALERCLVSLDGYCRQPLLYQGIVPMPPNREVLLQMATGLQYIHCQNLIHRDVKPENILISYDNPAVIKWADFGMSRSVTTGSRSFTWSQLKGTERWLAPELMDAAEKDKVKGSIKCDNFALGCVFFFFLVPTIHPFGVSKSETKANIKAGNAVNIDRLASHQVAFNIINGMIAKDPAKRTNLSVVIKTLQESPSAAFNMVPDPVPDYAMCNLSLTDGSENATSRPTQNSPQRMCLIA